MHQLLLSILPLLCPCLVYHLLARIDDVVPGSVSNRSMVEYVLYVVL